MRIKKKLGFNGLCKTLSKRFFNIPEFRQEGKIRHRLHDVFMSGFAMMYFQDPSLLEFQRRIEEGGQRSNLRRIFKVGSIPKG